MKKQKEIKKRTLPEKVETSLSVREEENKPLSNTQVTEKTIRDFLFGSGTNLTDQQQSLFIQTALSFNLNPIKREIYAIPFGNNFNIVTGYEVYLKVAERSGKLNGWRAWTEGNGPTMIAKIEIYRKDWRQPFNHEVYMAEYSRNSQIWKEKPHTMLKKVVIGQGFRLCFSELQGMPYLDEELGEQNQNDKNVEIEHEFIESKKEPQNKQNQTEPCKTIPRDQNCQPEPKQTQQNAAENNSQAHNLLDLNIAFDKPITIGKFKGTKFIDLAIHYLIWLKDKVTKPELIQKVIDEKIEIVKTDYMNILSMNDGDMNFIIDKILGKKCFWEDLSQDEKTQLLTFLHGEVKKHESK